MACKDSLSGRSPFSLKLRRHEVLLMIRHTLLLEGDFSNLQTPQDLHQLLPSLSSKEMCCTLLSHVMCIQRTMLAHKGLSFLECPRKELFIFPKCIVLLEAST